MKGVSDFTSKQETALAALLSEVTIEQACKKANISEATLWRYRQLPAFRNAYRMARREIIEDTISLLQRSSKKAVATLVRNMDSGTPSVEVSAAKSVLDYSFKGVENLEFAERVEMMEELLQSEAQRNQRERG